MYSIYTDKKGKIVVISMHNGEPFSGVAKCHPEDKFDALFGVDLAELRCKYNIAEKKCEEIVKQYDEIVKEKAKLDKKFRKICEEYKGCYLERKRLKEEIEELFKDNSNG